MAGQQVPDQRFRRVLGAPLAGRTARHGAGGAAVVDEVACTELVERVTEG